MKEIKSLESLKKLVEKYFFKGTFTNNYLMLNTYVHYINNGLLFSIEKQSNLYILYKKEEFFQLYYYLNDLSEMLDFDSNKPVTMEILYRGEKQKPHSILSYWEKCGFKQHITRDNMLASYKVLKILPVEKKSNIVIKYVDTDTETIYAKKLIENTFDKYTGDILTNEEIDNFVRKKNIICAYSDGKMSGILQFEIKNKVVWLGHIAVSPVSRGKGIANKLVRTYIVDNAKTPNTVYHLWVMQDNPKAISLYKKFGFIYGNKSSVSMLKK